MSKWEKVNSSLMSREGEVLLHKDVQGGKGQSSLSPYIGGGGSFLEQLNTGVYACTIE